MKLQPAVKQETGKIALGVAVLTALMVSVFLILGMFHVSVLLGAVLGAAMAVLNFFLMALSVQKAMENMDGVQLPPEEEPEDGEDADGDEADEKKQKPISPEALRAKRNMHLSYMGRMVLLAAYAVAAVAVNFVHPVAALLPLLFPRIVIFLNGIFAGKKGADAHE